MDIKVLIKSIVNFVNFDLIDRIVVVSPYHLQESTRFAVLIQTMSSGHRPPCFRGPLPIPIDHARKSATIQNVELTRKLSCPSRHRQAASAAILCTEGLDVIRKEAWSFYRTISGVRLCWELEEPKGPQGPSSSIPASHHRRRPPDRNDWHPTRPCSPSRRRFPSKSHGRLPTWPCSPRHRRRLPESHGQLRT